MEFEQTEQQTTGFEISELEKTNEINLPKDFVQHYLNYNGGYQQYEYVKGVKSFKKDFVKLLFRLFINYRTDSPNNCSNAYIIEKLFTVRSFYSLRLISVEWQQ
ncbi:SMI1/KNR4 family protein [Chryseobacterium sp. 09-1422]|uniref:SMI1/KNR4 family protein n=1 Tax=Chryseobacterium kimseyorum TaxID=2984028 RepID=A0ABT3HTC1_9FLAO|nr:SMI1/KNR4 family protein [Chryseobacterium kimseyorum]MCW3167038.1 SMI1/KNR4 family protein [Chryseobacterium kimseyorum]